MKIEALLVYQKLEIALEKNPTRNRLLDDEDLRENIGKACSPSF